MIARFDHRPMLTAALALATIVLLVAVVALSTLLITSPPAVAPTSGSVDDNPPVMGAGGEHYGDGWSNYGHNLAQPKPAQIEDAGGANYFQPDYYSHIPKPAQTGNGADLSDMDRHVKMIEALYK